MLISGLVDCTVYGDDLLRDAHAHCRKYRLSNHTIPRPVKHTASALTMRLSDSSRRRLTLVNPAENVAIVLCGLEISARAWTCIFTTRCVLFNFLNNAKFAAAEVRLSPSREAPPLEGLLNV